MDAAVKIEDAVFTFLDVETTGLSPRAARVCEVAAVSYRNGEKLAELAELVNPGCRIPPECTAVHGITDAMVKDRPGFAAVAPRLLGMLEGSYFVAHNAPFDRGFIEMELRRIGLHFPVPPHRVIDTLALARKWTSRKFASNKLGNIAADLGIKADGWHRALADVEMTSKVFHSFLASEGAVEVADIGRRR